MKDTNRHAIIFDFDGVILESFDIKTEAFRKIFSGYPERRIKRIVDYHTKHGGVSRFVKIRHIYKKILKTPLSEKEFRKKCLEFNQASFEFLLKCPYVRGVMAFIKKNRGRKALFIASGAPQGEIRQICRRRGIEKYFRGIFGSPMAKTEIIKKIIKKFNLDRNKTVFIGDALTDYTSARENGILPVIRITNYNKKHFRNIRVKKFSPFDSFV